MTEPADGLREFIESRLGAGPPLDVEPMQGGGSCEIFAVSRGTDRWVLRRAPRHASSSTAHDVLREFRFLDAIKDTDVPIARPILACEDPSVFESPFYVMERIDGVPIRAGIPEAWAAHPETHGEALDRLIDALVAIHAVDWDGCGLADLAHTDAYLERQVGRWLAQLNSYDGRPLPLATQLGTWLDEHRPAGRSPTLVHGDYKLDNVLFAPDPPPRLLAVVDWEMASIGDPLVDLAWAMIFHPGPEGTMHLGMSGTTTFDVSMLPSRTELIDRYAELSGRDISAIDWYHVFARWKLGIVLEGSYAKFQRGESNKPVHEYFGGQVDLLLRSADNIVNDPANERRTIP
jgi:aminoglycoside phosphotransferase (APT) family kinase protein